MARAMTVNGGDLYVDGSIACSGNNTPSAGTITDTHVNTSAAIGVVKLRHLIVAGTDFGIAADAAPGADVKRVLFVASGACTIRHFKATLRDAGSSSGITFDLLKATAGAATMATALSAPISYTHADTDNTPKSGTLSVTTLAAGDMLIAHMDYTSATGVLGPYAWVELDEAANA